ncbi:mitochondrial rna polymerase specificity factor [Moniliophthora roreri MCA 2997]|uniref:rRNA adenine N(6)-methyltransferase n=1 Tax=Moniliophthora roreri (strain MCA 2997) TaxID=1381753 RepID=V2XDY4_MONRO|nr:mitochondrial rna polymerase specificity factor [Moniliophthora roreri MCA 2997]
MSFLRPCLPLRLSARYSYVQASQVRFNSNSPIPEAPKKRGRPRKVQVTSPQEAELRPRGRPRKTPAPEATVESKAPKEVKKVKTFEEEVEEARKKYLRRVGRTKIEVEEVFPPVEQRIELPPSSQWQSLFYSAHQTHRVSISKLDTAIAVADAFVPAGSKGKVIVEAFPGPGQLTRALLKLPKERIDRIIVLEDYKNYYEYLHPLEGLDPRVKVLNLSGLSWETYDILHEQGLLVGIEAHSWDAGLHPKLQFISHLPINVHGEQLINQFIRFIPDRHWLFQYGRVPMNFLLSEYIWQRLTSKDLLIRCKLTAVADATVDCTVLLDDELQPYRDNFYPVPSLLANKLDAKVTGNRKAGVPFQAVSVIPTEKQIIGPGEMEAWDYCLRRLFVQRATPIEKAITLLGPGAGSLLEEIAGKVPLEKSPRELTMDQWCVILKVFNEWPFAPADLSIADLIEDSEGRQSNRMR